MAKEKVVKKAEMNGGEIDDGKIQLDQATHSKMFVLFDQVNRKSLEIDALKFMYDATLNAFLANRKLDPSKDWIFDLPTGKIWAKEDKEAPKDPGNESKSTPEAGEAVNETSEPKPAEDGLKDGLFDENLEIKVEKRDECEES